MKKAVCSIVVLIALISLVVPSFATSGWPFCVRGSADYNQAACIEAVEDWKNSESPYQVVDKAWKARAVYDWAVGGDPHVSCGTAVGAAGPLLHSDIVFGCDELSTPTPSPTETFTLTSTPTITPTATALSIPKATPTPNLDLKVENGLWLNPIHAWCFNQEGLECGSSQ